MVWSSKIALLTLAFVGVGSLVYLFLKREEKDEVDDENYSLKASSEKIVEIKVPKETVGLIVGRGGSNIKDIQCATDCVVNFRNARDTDTHKICVIRGSAEGIVLAETLIHKIIVNQPLIINFEMYVPDSACARLIGKNGENLRTLMRSSNTRIFVESAGAARDKTRRKITIKGSSDQIAFAKILIEQKVEEDREFRARVVTNLANRSPRTHAKYLLPAPGEIASEKEVAKHKETLVPNCSNGFFEVFVSAVEHPDRFWVQPVGQCTVELDKLSDEMTEYYSEEANRKLHLLKEVTSGQIVAAPFPFDNKWYRAEVWVKKVDEYDPEETEVSLYYVDYGDSALYKKKDLYELRADYLQLRFQAIECVLAKIKSKETWTEDEIEFFSDVTRAALWDPMTARIHNYKDRRSRWKRESSPVPCIELRDTRGGVVINVAEEMVKKGYAEWEETEKKTEISTEKEKDKKETLSEKEKDMKEALTEKKIPNENHKVKKEFSVVKEKDKDLLNDRGVAKKPVV